MGKISQNAKTFMALSSINNLLTAIWEVVRDRIPVLSNGKIPVDVASLNVTVSNASLEIANDEGNPVPVNPVSLSAAFGTASDSAAISDTANSGLISLFKRFLQRTADWGLSVTPWFTKSNTYFQTYTIAKNAEAIA